MKKLLEELGQLAFASMLIYSLLVIAADNIPENTPRPETCSCAGKADCHTGVFMIEEDRRAYCAIPVDGQTCCIVDPKRD